MSVSTTCETRTGDFLSDQQCGKPAVRGYPALGGGYMMMCDEHSQPHLPYCVTLEQAQRGEKPDYGTPPTPIARAPHPEETNAHG